MKSPTDRGEEPVFTAIGVDDVDAAVEALRTVDNAPVHAYPDVSQPSNDSMASASRSQCAPTGVGILRTDSTSWA